jgi:hypothetical protein
MVRMTEDLRDGLRPLFGSRPLVRSIVICCVASAILVTMGGCSSASSGTGKKAASAPAGQNMAGPAQEVIISRSALDTRPQPWVLTSPESAVRSYLDWVSYAYRIGQSDVATPTMSAKQEVRADSFLQLNLEKGKVIDQTLTSVTFGVPSTEGTRTLLPAQEKWTYRYVSIKTAGKTLAGPFPARYDTTYTVMKTKHGWVVDSIAVKALGTIK